MNKSQRIYLNTGNTTSDKYIKLRLEQDVDTLEVLSMSISSKEIYQSFNADYGVLVGRVLANEGIGIPNARISIFIPLDDTDATDGEISSIYPYTTPRDKNKDGKRYNLLPRVSKKDPHTGIVTPHQAFGSFPTKEELLANQPYLDVYKKYYKYTALTNGAGDYMIFGVPIGTQVVHMSADITDIGPYSMTPVSMVKNLGYSPNLFIDDVTIKPNNDLNDLPNVQTEEITVEVVPFWGDVDNFEIGITRQDFRIRAKLESTFIIFGSAFTDAEKVMWCDKDPAYPQDIVIQSLYLMWGGDHDIKINMTSTGAKRPGNITEKIYYYPNTISDQDILIGAAGAQPQDMLVLDTSEYISYKRGGDFVFIIKCNRRKVITNETGNETEVDDSFSGGIYTRFRGFITVEITPDDLGFGSDFHGQIGYGSHEGRTEPLRYKLKIPQGENYPDLGQTFNSDDNSSKTQNWRKQDAIFSVGKLYSIAKYNGVVGNIDSNQTPFVNTSTWFLHHDYVNSLGALGPERTVGIITVNNGNLVANAVNGSYSVFGTEWLNLSVYLPQVGELVEDNSDISYERVTTNFTGEFDKINFTGEFDKINFNGTNIYRQSEFYLNNNNQLIGANVKNTKWFARSDIHMTRFVEVPKQDVVKMNNLINSNNGHTGFANTISNLGLAGTYQALNSPTFYFSAGVNGSNCIKFLYDLQLI